MDTRCRHLPVAKAGFDGLIYPSFFIELRSGPAGLTSRNIYPAPEFTQGGGNLQ